MTKLRTFDKDEFLTPFDKLFDTMMETQFPEVSKSVGVNAHQGSAYPKVNVYEYDDKVGIVAEIPGLDKTQLNVEVEDNVLTISGDKHGVWEEEGAKVIRRELKASSFKRSFQLGELLDGDNINAKSKDGVLSISVPKTEPVVIRSIAPTTGAPKPPVAPTKAALPTNKPAASKKSVNLFPGAFATISIRVSWLSAPVKV